MSLNVFLYFTNLVFKKYVMLYQEFINKISSFKNTALARALQIYFSVQQAT